METIILGYVSQASVSIASRWRSLHPILFWLKEQAEGTLGPYLCRLKLRMRSIPDEIHFGCCSLSKQKVLLRIKVTRFRSIFNVDFSAGSSEYDSDPQ